MDIKKFTPLLLLVLLLSASAQAQYDFDSLYKHDKLFKQTFKKIYDTADFYNNDRVLEFTIEADFKELVKHKNDDSYREALLEYQVNDSVKISRQVKIKPRGNLRRDICYYPPLKVNFKKKELHLKALKDFDKVKMVGTCKNSKGYEQYVLSEYYIYKMYNQITDYSFGVRLLKIKYVDTGRKNKSDTRMAFFIEPIGHLADRNKSIEIEIKNLHPDRTNYELVNTFSVFQYMIGNTDFSIPGLHNVKMIKSLDPNVYQPVAIPYDFDYTGIIDAHYAIPSDALAIESVTERLFRGFCRTKEEFRETFEIFNQKKNSIISIYQDSPYLTNAVKKKSVNYLNTFYETINSDISIQREFLDNCRTKE